jgi:hypothetical protein
MPPSNGQLSMHGTTFPSAFAVPDLSIPEMDTRHNQGLGFSS